MAFALEPWLNFYSVFIPVYLTTHIFIHFKERGNKIVDEDVTSLSFFVWYHCHWALSLDLFLLKPLVTFHFCFWFLSQMQRLPHNILYKILPMPQNLLTPFSFDLYLRTFLSYVHFLLHSLSPWKYEIQSRDLTCFVHSNGFIMVCIYTETNILEN